MRRTDSTLSLTALVVAFALSACSKGDVKSTADGAKKADTSSTVATKPVDTKAPDANTKAPGAKSAPANGAASKTVDAKTQSPASTKPAPVPVTTTVAPAVAVSGGTIDPGMTKAQVIALLGKPASDRARGDFTYLLFSNGVEKEVGMSDLVVLEGDKVVDAVLRAPNRSFSGTSSSPRAIPATEAAKAKPPVPPKGGT